MGQAALHWDDLIETATLTATSESNDLVVGNLQDVQPSVVWRGATAQETITADFGSSQYVQATFLLRHNFTAEATIRVRLSDNSNLSSPVYDVTFYAWPSVLGYDEELYDGSRFVGYDNAPIVGNFREEQFKSVIVLADKSGAIDETVDDESYTGRYLGVTITDPINAAGYVQCGVWRAGPLVTTRYDISQNRSMGYVDNSQRFRSYSQSVFVNERNRYRYENFTFEFLSEQEFLSNFSPAGAVFGASKPVLYLPYLESSYRALEGMIYGLCTSAPQLQQVRPNFTNASGDNSYPYAASFTIEEML